MVEVLAKQGDTAALRALADAAGGWFAFYQLTDLLTERGEITVVMDMLQARINAGDGLAADRLADLLARQGNPAAADRLRRYGFNPDGSFATGPAQA